MNWDNVPGYVSSLPSDAAPREHLSTEDGVKRGALALAAMLAVAVLSLSVIAATTGPKRAR